MKRYSAEQIHELLVHPELQGEQDTPFYRRKILNYRGDDNGRPYSEIIANWMIDADGLDLIIRGKAELQGERAEFADGRPIHTLADATKPVSAESPRLEEAIAKRLFVLDDRAESDGLFAPNDENYCVTDYQVPVNRVNGSKDGKVDLIVEGDNETLLTELKRHDSDETLLRAMTEAYTYWLLVEDTKQDRGADDAIACTAYERFASNYGNARLRPGVMIFPGTQAWEDYEDVINGNRACLRELLQRWNIRVFKVSFVGDKDDVSNAVFSIELMSGV